VVAAARAKTHQQAPPSPRPRSIIHRPVIDVVAIYFRTYPQVVPIAPCKFTNSLRRLGSEPTILPTTFLELMVRTVVVKLQGRFHFQIDRMKSRLAADFANASKSFPAIPNSAFAFS